VALEGTKVKANASRHKVMRYERMQQAEAELKTLQARVRRRVHAAHLRYAETQPMEHCSVPRDPLWPSFVGLFQLCEQLVLKMRFDLLGTRLDRA
jgi:hypothetical protein